MEDLKNLVNPEKKKISLEELISQVNQYTPEALSDMHNKAYEKEMALGEMKKNQGRDLSGLMLIGDYIAPGANLQQNYKQIRDPKTRAIAQEEAQLNDLQSRLMKGAMGYQAQEAKKDFMQAQSKAMEAKNKAKAVKEKTFKDQEWQSGLFASRMSQAEEEFEKLAKEGYDRTKLEESAMALLPGATKSDFLKRAEQAERNFLNAVLRKESGAAIGPSEFKSGELQYFPRAGDPPEVVAQKKRNRDLAISALSAASGGAFDKVQERYKKDYPESSGASKKAKAGSPPSRAQQLREKYGL